MDQLTLEQAAMVIPEVPDHFIEGEPETYIDGHRNGFKAGAEWQKEQLKAKWEAMSNILENGFAKDLVDRVAAQLLQD